MNTPATQPTDIDKKLEEMVVHSEETPCPVRDDKQHCEHWYDESHCCACSDGSGRAAKVRPLADALLRARRDIGKLQEEAGSTDPGGMIPHEVAQRIRLLLADTLADTELEEVLR